VLLIAQEAEMKKPIKLTKAECRLLTYLQDADKSRARSEIAGEIGCHPTYVGALIKKLKDQSVINELVVNPEAVT
jgi:DNA-binding MarR family transcriptional regulator